MAGIAFVFDKAVFHLPSVRARGLDEHQAYVHGGLFWGWAVERGLTAPWLEDNTPEVFARYRRGEITGPELLKAWDGALLDDMFSDEGLAFAAHYLHFETGDYLRDYVATLAAELPSELHVADTRDNQEKLNAVLDERYRAWRATWDPASGRPDLRTEAEPEPAPEVPEVLRAPAIAVGRGVPLPGGPLGIRAARPETIAAVRAAAPWVLLVPEGAEVQCVARAEVLDGEATVLPEPDPEDEEDMGLLEEIRLLAADVLKRRIEQGQPPGLLALAPGLAGARLVDVVGREVQLAREEALIVLEAPDLRTRAETVRDALLRCL